LIPRESLSETVASGGESITIPDLNKSMKTIVSEYQFVDSFRACGRETQFSVPARRALFEHFENIEQWTDTDIELDPIAVCCEWAEYPSALAAAKDFGFQEGIDSKEESALEWLQNRTQVIEFEGGLVIQQF
jgi:hypothetical protein